MAEQDQYLTEAEAAERLGVDPRTLALRAPDHGLSQFPMPLGLPGRRYLKTEIEEYAKRMSVPARKPARRKGARA